MKHILLVFIFLANIYAVANGPEKHPEPSKEERQKRAEHHEKIAEMHKKMADCLRTDKTVAQCHEALKQDCEAKGGDCPMMPGMGKHPEMKGKMGKGRE